MLKEVFDTHGEDSISVVPSVHETLVATVSSHLVICVEELLLDCLSPALVAVAPGTAPLLSIIPWILKANQMDLLFSAPTGDINRSNVQD